MFSNFRYFCFILFTTWLFLDSDNLFEKIDPRLLKGFRFTLFGTSWQNFQMAADKICCVTGCIKSRDDNIVLHKFPNPEKDPTRFYAWLQAVGGNLLCLDNMYVFKYRRICHKHFEVKYYTRSKMLSNNAIPTLHMSGIVAKRTPLADVANTAHASCLQEPGTSVATSLEQDVAVASSASAVTKRTPLADVAYNAQASCLQKPGTSAAPSLELDVAVASTSSYKAVKTPNTKKRIAALKREVKHLNISKEKYVKRLKKAMKLSENTTFQKAIKNFTTMAAIFTMLQFRESAKHKMGRRFTADEKVMALHLFKRGPRAYRTLQNIFVLPSPFTLSRMVSKANIRPGINDQIFLQLKKQASKMKLDDKLCTLIFDEMALTPHIDYNRRHDKITGLVDNGDTVRTEIADHVLVMMIRGVLKNYKQPISYTFCAGSTKRDELASIIKKNIRKLKEAGFKVLATVCDQGTSNVSAISYLIEQTRLNYAREGKELRGEVFEVDNEEVIPLFDVPHLLKGVRNNLLTKNLKYTMDGVEKVAKWDHILQLYENNPTYKGIRLIKKLTECHCDPKKIPKMKVKYASQIFSHTVGVNMGYLADQGILPVECKDTADILLFFDQLFDSMNGSFNNSSSRSGKPLLLPVTPKSGHQEVWTKSKLILRSMKYVSKQGNVGVVPSITNWIRTIENMEKLKITLFNKYNIKSIWCRHFNQDPLENFFGSIRSHGYRNNSPTCAGFESAFVALLVNNLSSTYSPHSNCEDDSGVIFKSLKTLFFTEHPNLNPESSEIQYEDLYSEDIIVDLTIKKSDPRIMAALQYVTGYLLKQCRLKVFKNCKTCLRNLYSREENEYIKLREYNKQKKNLTYPAHALVNCVSNTQDIFYFIIKRTPNIRNIKNYIKVILEVRLDFDFLTCQTHKKDIIEKLCNSSCLFFLYNWARDVNKILTGSSQRYDTEDVMQRLASEYCNKRKRT